MGTFRRYRYTDFESIGFTNVQTGGYRISDNGVDFYADEIEFYATEDC